MQSAHQSLPTAKTVYLQEVLHEAQEYHGVSALSVYSLYFIVGMMALYWNWNESDAIFRAQVGKVKPELKPESLAYIMICYVQ